MSLVGTSPNVAPCHWLGSEVETVETAMATIQSRILSLKRSWDELQANMQSNDSSSAMLAETKHRQEELLQKVEKLKMVRCMLDILRQEESFHGFVGESIAFLEDGQRKNRFCNPNAAVVPSNSRAEDI